MVSNEFPNVPFTIIRTRFQEGVYMSPFNLHWIVVSPTECLWITFYNVLVGDSDILPFRLSFATPKTIVYDNACNLHDYALNRDPFHFKNSSQFLVDRLHWRDHTGSVQYIVLRTRLHYPAWHKIGSSSMYINCNIQQVVYTVSKEIRESHRSQKCQDRFLLLSLFHSWYVLLWSFFCIYFPRMFWYL